MKAHIPALMDSIRNLDTGGHELEIILRDNASTDGSPDIVERDYQWVRLIRGKQNVGFAGSNNIMLRNATGDIICGANLDTILSPQFLVEGIRALEESPEAVAVNTNMLMPWTTTLEAFTNTQPQDLPAYEYQLTPYGFIRYIPVRPEIHGTNFITGGGFFIRRSALKEGEPLFDPSLHMYCEDTELSLRLLKRGSIVYAPGAIMYHNHPPIKGRTYAELRKLVKITWNRFYVMAKHHSPASFAARYPLYIWGIVSKMSFLGLPLPKRLLGYAAGAAVALPFALLLPYWLVRSFGLRDEWENGQ
jgi:GT2 family glycosyltransferase